MKKRKKDRLTTLLIGFLLLCIAYLCINAFINPILLESKNQVIELGSKYDPKDNIEQVFLHSSDSVKIKNNVNTKKVGNYTTTYSLNNYKVICNVEVKDTQAPQFTTQEYITDLKEDVKPKSFIKKIQDESKYTLSFQSKPTKDSNQQVVIIATDKYGNAAKQEATLIRKKDKKKPTIKTPETIHVMKNENYDFEKDIKIKDNYDKNPTANIDTSSIDFATPGNYKLTVTATDRSGNEATKEVKVVVKHAQKVVYLTFDDGPSENTDKILKILKQYNAKATFFVTGNNQAYNSSIKKAFNQGHTIGLHTYSHDYAKIYTSTDAYFADLQQVSDMVKSITGQETKAIRFPGGASNTISAQYSQGIMTKLVDMVHEKGYEYYDWNCSSADASGNTVATDTIIQSSISCNYDNIMILFHDSSPKTTTVEALPSIIKHYKKEGYVFRAITSDTPEVHHGVNN